MIFYPKKDKNRKETLEHLQSHGVFTFCLVLDLVLLSISLSYTDD